MSVSSKKKKIKFTFQSFVRLIIFSIIVFIIISLTSGKTLNPPKEIDSTLAIDEETQGSILGKTTEIYNNLYQSIPENSRNQIENLNQNPAFLFVQEKINFIKEQNQDFPQKQIKEIQKMVVKNIYENTIRNIDSQ